MLSAGLTHDPPEWRVTAGPVPYSEAVAEMEAHAEAIARQGACELVWLLEHPPIYTAGTSATDDELLDARFPVFRTGRGGRLTYHGPGQRVGYVLLDLKRRGSDVRRFVHNLEEWMIRAVARFGVTAARREGMVGIWVARADGREDKLGAIGVRVRRWVSYHGVALNVAPDLSHFGGIVPCGIRGAGVTSLRDLGVAASMEEVDTALRASFYEVFGS